MNRTKKGLALSVGVVAGVAMAGFVPSPADASAHATASESAAGVTTAGAGRAHPGLTPAPSHGAAQIVTGVQAANSRGFVPRPGAKAIVTTSTCYKNTCLGVTHSGWNMYQAGAHFYNWPGVHVGHIAVFYNGVNSPASYVGPYFGSHQEDRLLTLNPVSSVVLVCAKFNTVPPANSGHWVCVTL